MFSLTLFICISSVEKKLLVTSPPFPIEIFIFSYYLEDLFFIWNEITLYLPNRKETLIHSRDLLLNVVCHICLSCPSTSVYNDQAFFHIFSGTRTMIRKFCSKWHNFHFYFLLEFRCTAVPCLHISLKVKHIRYHGCWFLIMTFAEEIPCNRHFCKCLEGFTHLFPE